MELQAVLGLKTLLAGGALHLMVLALLVGLQRGLTAARVVALLAGETRLELVHALTVVPQCDFRTKSSIAMSAGVLQLPRVASEVVAADVVQRVAAEVAQRAEVRGVLVVDARLVLPQFGHGPKGLVAHFALVATDPRVEGLVLLQPVAPGGGEGAVPAAVRPHTVVFERHVLLHASLLLAGERAVLAMQTFRVGNFTLPFFMNGLVSG